MAFRMIFKIISTLLFCVVIHSVSIQINNAGFEVDGILEPNTYAWGRKLLADWPDFDPFNLMDLSAGIENPTNGTAFNDSVFGDNSPEGSNSVYIEVEDTNTIGKGAIGITQKLSDVVEENTTYVLSVYVGNPAANCWSDSTDGPKCSGFSTFPGYSVVLIAGSSILAQDNNAQIVPNGEWRESSVTVDIYPGDINIGQELNIRLVDENLIEGEVTFDDVRLVAVKHTTQPTLAPTEAPTTPSPTNIPSQPPTMPPTMIPTLNPSESSTSPTFISETPTQNTQAPFINPTVNPTLEPTLAPTLVPTPDDIATSHSADSSHEYFSTTYFGEMTDVQTLFEFIISEWIWITVAAIVLFICILICVGNCVFCSALKRKNIKLVGRNLGVDGGDTKALAFNEIYSAPVADEPPETDAAQNGEQHEGGNAITAEVVTAGGPIGLHYDKEKICTDCGALTMGKILNGTIYCEQCYGKYMDDDEKDIDDGEEVIDGLALSPVRDNDPIAIEHINEEL